ncbi:thiamine pyrophosphate-binding protein [Pseudahrensia aquimaris]|uniref:Thiamine pyrophosphate-binding protein n=1 Tax=Pseudahrensia aquimaris TaxID=744461 RepID=A0ABW3FFH7_9HYPH
MPTAAQVLVQCLLNQEVEMGFGVPGESYLAVLDALHDVSNAFKFIGTRNEGGAAFMAEAYGKLTGKPGICFVTRGPGATNASIGIHTAMQDSSPMVVFVGQIARSMKGREAFQELDYKAVFGSMAKWAVEIDDPNRVPEIVARAFQVALAGRPGPVVVALPEDMLTEECTALPRGKIVAAKPHMTDVDSKAIRERLAAAHKPVLIVGGGGWNASGQAALKRFAEANTLPVVSAFRSQDLMDNASPSYAGDAGVGMPPHVRKFLDESDLLIAVNVRFGEMLTDGYTLFDPATFDKPLVHIHASEAEIGKIFTPDLAVLSCPNAALNTLAALDPIEAPVWAKRTQEVHAAWETTVETPPQPGALDMSTVVAHLRTALPPDAIVTNGAGNFAIWPSRHLPYGEAMTLLGPQSGAMGAGVPAAVMAKIHDPTRFVLCFAGDGDFQMNCQELGTALQHGAAPVILILNNGQYGTIRMHQERDYPTRVSGTQIVNPDFAALAHAYGMYGEQITQTDEFPAAFDRACASPTGAVLDLIVDPEGLAPRMTVTSLHQR